MKNTKIFLGVAFISAIFMQSALGEYVRKTAPNADEDQPKFTPRPTKPLPIPQKKQVPQTASPTASQQQPRLDTPTQTVHKPLPTPPQPARKPLPTPPQTVRKPLPIAPNPFDTPMTEKEREAAAKDTDNPFANVLRPATEVTSKKETAAETGTVTQWQRATPAGIEEKRKADEQAAKSAEQAAKIKEVADRLQPKQPTIWEKIKQGATTFLGRKPAVEISAPTDFRHLSTEEAAAKAQADINAAKAQAANTAAQEKERSAIQKLGTKIVDQINIFTAKISGPRAPTSAESASIKGAITGFVDSVRNKFATATQPIRKTMSAQLDSITRNLNQAIAKIPVNSPQRKEFLTSKGMINLSKLYGTSERITKAVQDSKLSTAEKLMARTDFFVALETLKRNPQSTGLGLTQEKSSAFAEKIRTLIQSNTKPDFQKQIDAAKLKAKLAITEVGNLERQQADLYKQAQALPSKTALESQAKELQAKLTEINKRLLEEQDSTKRESIRAEAAAPRKALTETQGKLTQLAEITKQLDAIAPKLEAAKKEQIELNEAIAKAQEVLDTPATRMQKANAALSSAKRKVAGAASDLGRSIAKLPASARSLGATLKTKADALANAIKTGTPAAKIAALRKDLSGALTTFKNKAKGKASKKVIQNVGVNVEEMVKEAAEVRRQQEEKARVNAEAAAMASDRAAETTKP